ncbi:MAG: cupin [Candidatus Altiarchaeales archaeon]|nr:MAG: cupin [Candidatus Altiarchaeales archaeon]
MKLIDVKIVEKPWGREIWFAYEKEYAGKILELRKGTRTSLHYHKRKRETMYVLDGRVIIYSEKNDEIRLKSGNAITINPGDRHRIYAEEDTKILEVSTPELNDVVRVEDDYGRD